MKKEKADLNDDKRLLNKVMKELELINSNIEKLVRVIKLYLKM